MTELNKVTSVETKEVNNVEVVAKKRVRRGLGEVRGTTRLKFTEQDANRSNFLFLGHLDSIELSSSVQKEDSNLVSFAGLEVPSLTFTFASNADEITRRKYVTLRINPAESNAYTIPQQKEAWKVEQPLNWLKHILEVFVLKGKPMNEEMMDALELPYCDFDDDLQYVQVEPEVVLAGWKTLFENFLSYMNNDGKPVYKAANGKLLPIWMKLLRYTKIRGEWKAVLGGNQAGDLGFSNFVGEGCIELYSQNVIPSLHVDVAKESIIHQQVKEPKAPTMPNIGVVGVVPVAPIADSNMGVQAAPTVPHIAGDLDQMPF